MIETFKSSYNHFLFLCPHFEQMALHLPLINERQNRFLLSYYLFGYVKNSLDFSFKLYQCVCSLHPPSHGGVYRKFPVSTAVAFIRDLLSETLRFSL